MDNINFTSFKAFVMAQDENREINHWDWDSCAVGDYMLYSTGYRALGIIARCKLLISIEGLYDTLCNADDDTMPTYKELQLLLTGYRGDV